MHTKINVGMKRLKKKVEKNNKINWNNDNTITKFTIYLYNESWVVYLCEFMTTLLTTQQMNSL